VAHDDGIYVSARQRRRRRRRTGTVVAGLAVLLGAGAYAGTSWYLGRESTVSGIAPIVTPSVTPSAVTPWVVPQSAPTAGPPPGTISAARRSWLPSPVPSPSGLTDDDMAAAQVSRLLQPRPGGVAAADTGAMVRNEITPDGAQVRIVSAHYDLTERWKLLGAADAGEPVGAARCTQNFKVDGMPLPQNRPGLLLCWRTSPGKSIIVVATRAGGRPSPAVGATVIAREWERLG
jgi:hypothetical protein